MSTTALEQTLRELGVRASIDGGGGVAVLRLDGDDPRLADDAWRRTLVALAAAHGFRNLALEVVD